MRTTYIVTPNFPSDICGIGDYSSFLVSNLKKENLDVHVITFSENVVPTDKIHVIKKAYKNNLSAWLRCLKGKDDVATIIFQYEPYSYNKIGIPLYLIYIALGLKLKGYKISVMFHEVATRLYISNPKKAALSFLQLTVAYFITAISSIRATSTSFNANQLRPYKFNFLPIPSNFTNTDNVSSNADNVLKIGCFANRVDSFFASIIAKIVQDKLGILYLIGKQSKANDDAWTKYNLHNQEDIIITGTLSQNGIEDCFDNLSMFLHLEKVDDNGRGGASLKNGSLAAALSWGLPVITSKGDMTDETMLQNKLNILFVEDSFNEDSWIKAISQLKNNIELRNTIKNNAFKFYNQTLSWPVITKKYISLINNISINSA